VGGVYTEVVLIALAAMVSPTTLTFSIFALVLGDRPLKTGFLFYIGALSATLGVGIAAAFVLGDVAASQSGSSPKTWMSVDAIAARGWCSRGSWRGCAGHATRSERSRWWRR
jgi:hypothetical protein